MTDDQAEIVMGIAAAGGVAQTLGAQTYAFLMRHLLPLDFAATERSVSCYVANHKWVSTLAELLEACGLPPDDPRAGARARADLVTAAREGGRLVRDLRSPSGWSYVAPGEPTPPGALAAAAVAAEPLAAAAAPPPLPPGRVAIRAVLLARDRRIAALVGRARLVGPDRPPHPAPAVDPAELEAELAAFDARYRAQEARQPTTQPAEETTRA